MATPTIRLWSSPVNVAVELIEIEWDESVSGFAFSSVTILSDYGAAHEDMAFKDYSTSTHFYFDVRVPVHTIDDGRFTVVVAENAVNQGNDRTERSFDWGDGPAEATITLSVASTAYTGQTIQVSISADQSVTNLALSDFSVDVGTLSNFQGSGSSYTLDWTLPSTGAGSGTITLAENSVDEDNPSATASVTYSLITATLTPGTTDAVRGEQVDIDIVFPDDVENLELSDLSATSGTLSNLTGSGQNWSVRLTLPTTGSGSSVVTLAASSVTPTNAAASTASISYGPAVITLTPDVDAALTSQQVVVTISADHDITNLELSDFTASIGSVSNLAGSGQSWTLRWTMPSSGMGSGTLTLGVNSVPQGNAEVTASVTYGPTTITLSASDSTPLTSEVVTVTISANQDITELTLSDFTASVGTLSNLTGSGQSWTLRWTMPNTGSGTATLMLPAASVPEGNAEAEVSVTYSPTTITLTTAFASAYTGQAVTVTLVASQAITGLDLSDFTASVGLLSNLTGSGENWSLRWTMPTSGVGIAVLTLAEDGVSQGNAETQLSVVYAPVAPVIRPASTTGLVGSEIDLEIEFGHDVTGLTDSDFSLSNGGTISNVQGSGQDWTVTLTLPTSNVDGSTIVTLVENSVDQGNYQGTTTINFTTITVAVTFDETSSYWGQDVGVNFRFSSNVTGIALSDLTASVGMLSNLTGSGRDWEAVLTLPTTGAGSAEVTVAAGAASEGNSSGSGSISYAAITATITASAMDVLIGVNFTFNVDFVADVTGIAQADFSVDNGMIVGFTRVRADYYEVEVMAPASGSGTIEITLAANSANENNQEATGSTTWISEHPDAPVIDMVAEQNILVDTDYELRIGITNNPEDAYAVGELEAFGAHWDSGAGQLVVRGRSEELVTGKRYTVYANKDAFERDREVIYNVIPSLPVISAFGPFTVYKGYGFRVQVGIVNHPTRIVAIGPWIELDSEINDLGILIFADEIPDRNYQIDDDEVIKVVAGNTAGEVMGTGMIDLLDGDPPVMSEVSADDGTDGTVFNWSAVAGALSYAYRLNADSEWVDIGNVTTYTIMQQFSDISGIEFRVNSPWIGHSVVAFMGLPNEIDHSPRVSYGVAVDATYIHSFDRDLLNSHTDLHRVSTSDRVVANDLNGFLATLVDVNDRGGLMCVDNTYLYFMDPIGGSGANTLKRIRKDGTGTLNSYTLDAYYYPHAIFVDGIYLYVIVFSRNNNNDSRIYRYTRSNMSRTVINFNYPSGLGQNLFGDTWMWTPLGGFADGTYFYFMESDGETFRALSKDLSTRHAAEDKIISLPSDVAGIHDCDLYDGNVYVGSSRKIYIRSWSSSTPLQTVPSQITSGLDITFNSSLGQVTYHWNALTGDDTGGSPILRYEIDTGTGAWQNGGLNTSFTESWIGSGFLHGFRVRGVNAIGSGDPSVQYTERAP